MSITRNNILQHELIGLQAEVVQSSNESLLGKKGVIVNETRNTIVLDEEGDLKTVPKSVAVFRVTLPSGEGIKVNGKKLVARPEDRIKKYG